MIEEWTPIYREFVLRVPISEGDDDREVIALISQVMRSYKHSLSESQTSAVVAWFSAAYAA